MGKGKLIVFEGTDGSGKSTQFDLMIKWLESEGKDFRRVRFPRYDEPSSMLVRMYLQGEFGEHPGDVNPYAASTFYAVDRFASFIQDWQDYYKQGGLVVSDRYTTSNAVHQGGKFLGSAQYDFLKWLYDLEFKKMKLPEPDLVILMDMPIELSQKLLQIREDSGKGKKDIHELDVEYLEKCRQTALTAADFYGWHVVRGNDGDEIRPIEEISNEIKAIISEFI